MTRRPVDLSSHLNQTVERGHPADFPVALRPLLYRNDTGDLIPVQHRQAVVRTDLHRALGVVSDRYELISHDAVLSTVQQAIATLDVGPVPRGVYVDRGGARMRALYKFPALTRDVGPGDAICPCLRIQNTYDGTSRIALHIGAFRFVCTNLAVGGGGVFAGGFMALHVGAIDLDEAATQLTEYLEDFEGIVALYRAWSVQRADTPRTANVLETLNPRAALLAANRVDEIDNPTVFDAYNAATYVATHELRSARLAFETLARINRGFQEQFPVLA